MGRSGYDLLNLPQAHRPEQRPSAKTAAAREKAAADAEKDKGKEKAAQTGAADGSAQKVESRPPRVALLPFFFFIFFSKGKMADRTLSSRRPRTARPSPPPPAATALPGPPRADGEGWAGRFGEDMVRMYFVLAEDA